MKTRVLFLSVLTAVLLLVGCSTVESRIGGHQAAFASWPPQVQQRVRAGQIDVGFTMEQVQVALGSPDYTFARTAQTGSFQVWSYRDRGPRFSLGVGMGSYGRGGGFSTGVGVDTGRTYPDEKLRVIFDASGRVTQIEEVRTR
ncbi:hypothetical protein [Opitutus sp. ER46]|uniref:hypothetical protein n=1 Tax=Opitutus sp. ER46 TaxID=2161864 RepID=UPI000D31B35D|nr:hypothetical protein [Opitutus sp. ER46]PTX96682.1 hypothetical protein DB354_08495 [Opitutus sp. ER46]